MVHSWQFDIHLMHLQLSLAPWDVLQGASPCPHILILLHVKICSVDRHKLSISVLRSVLNRWCVCVFSYSYVWPFVTLWTVACRVSLWDSPGKNTTVGGHALLQGIFSTQGLNPCLLCLLHCRQILYHWATEETQIGDTSPILGHLLGCHHRH